MTPLRPTRAGGTRRARACAVIGYVSGSRVWLGQAKVKGRERPPFLLVGPLVEILPFNAIFITYTRARDITRFTHSNRVVIYHSIYLLSAHSAFSYVLSTFGPLSPDLLDTLYTLLNRSLGHQKQQVMSPARAIKLYAYTNLCFCSISFTFIAVSHR